MTVYDLTHTLYDGMPVFPGDPAVGCAPAATLVEAGYGLTALSLGSHSGTHMDAPAHVLPGGPTLDALAVEGFMGDAFVVDCAPAAPGAPIDVQALSGVPQADFILLSTGWDTHWGAPDYFTSYPVLTPQAARRLARLARKGVGVDAPSIDGAGEAALVNHRILLGAGLVVVESLTGLAPLAGRRCTFCALPLRFASSDGAPVRAVAYLEG